MINYDALTLINYCHPDCTPLLNIMRLPKDEAFALACKMAEAHPETTAFYRFADFKVYYELRRRQDEYLFAEFEKAGGKPAQRHPLSFVVEGSEYLAEWFSGGIETKLALADIAPEHISFTIGDSGSQYDKYGKVELLTAEKLREKLEAFDGSFRGFMEAAGRNYIEAQLWDDRYLPAAR